MTPHIDELEAALAAARARLAAARAVAERGGRTPLRRLRAIARILRSGAAFPAPAATEPDPQAARWREHALELESEIGPLRAQVGAADRQATELRDELERSRLATRRFAIALTRLDLERQATEPRPPPAPTDTTTDYGAWSARTAPSAAMLRTARDVGAIADGPCFSVVVPVYRVPLEVLRDTVESVRHQTYVSWQLCIAHAEPADAAGRAYLRALAAADPRIALVELAENGGISRNSNAALALATGEFVCLLDHDDILPQHALSTFATLLRDRPETDFLYSDKDMTDAGGSLRINPLFKPAWSPETMLTVNYLTHLNALRTSIVRDIGGWRPQTDGAQDWDIFLRFTERTDRIACVRDVLYRWRMIESSVAGGGMSTKPYAREAQLRTLEDALRRRGVAAEFAFEADGATPRPRWRSLPERVSVIVLCLEDDVASATAEAVAQRCGERVGEILVPSAAPPAAADGRVRGVAVGTDAGAAARLGAGLAAATADACVVIDAGTLPETDEGWIDDLVGPLAIPGVAVVAPKVLAAHADVIVRTGIVFNPDGSEADLFRGAAKYAYGLIGSAHWMRNVSAVGGGMFAARTAVARELGFADQPDYPRADVDFCLRAGRAGWRLVSTPFVTAREHAEPALAARQGDAGRGRALIKAIWPAGVPCFHPLLVSDGPQQQLVLPAERATEGHDYEAEAQGLTAFYDAAPELLGAARARRAPHRPWRSVLWLLPDFGHAYYGGVATILRFAAYLARRHGVQAHFAVCGLTPPDVLAARVCEAFPGLSGSSFHRIAALEDAAGLPYADAGFATLWTTAYYLLRADVGERCYFVQDNEPQFYPAGSVSALVEATYRFGLRAVCNTETLAGIVRGYGGDAVHFTPAVDASIFHAEGRQPHRSPKRLFAYGRPGHARNGFELLAHALGQVKRQFGDELDIVTAGAPWTPAAYGLEGVLTNLGLLGYRATGDLYRTCDAGAVLMMTSHPSYLPLELMACGAAVVTNRNPRTAWLLRDEDNALLAETTPSAFAARISEALADDAGRATLTERAGAFVRRERTGWDGEWARLVETLWS